MRVPIEYFCTSSRKEAVFGAAGCAGCWRSGVGPGPGIVAGGGGGGTPGAGGGLGARGTPGTGGAGGGGGAEGIDRTCKLRY